MYDYYYYDWEDYWDRDLDYCDCCGKYLFSDFEFKTGICDRCASGYPIF